MTVEIRTTIVTRIHDDDFEAIGALLGENVDPQVAAGYTGNLILKAAEIGGSLITFQNDVLDENLPEGITIVGLPSATTTGVTRITVNVED